MRFNKERSNGSDGSEFERLVGGFGEPKSMLLEPIQGSIDARTEDEYTEARTRTCVDTASGMTSEEFKAKFLPTDATGGAE